MAATARQIPLTDEDIESSGGGGGAYAQIEVPGDYEAVLVMVEDYDKRSEGKSFGWKFEYQVETPSGTTVSFYSYLSFSENARWKLVEVLKAHEVDLSDGLNTVDPNELMGEAIGVHIDFPRDNDGKPTSKYREIALHFPLADEEPPTI
jgi:hypothetical protein